MARPNPTQTRNLDEVTLRRELKELLPSAVALDRQELAELLDFSNQAARYQVLRKKFLARGVAQLQPGDMLTDQQRAALIAYRMGDGPRPDFAMLATPGGHYYGESLLAPDEQRPEAVQDWPQQVAGEPGRYVQPTGRFAQSEDDAFRPDTR
jgi:hypothetical protein